jgi:hypothetical protein
VENWVKVVCDWLSLLKISEFFTDISFNSSSKADMNTTVTITTIGIINMAKAAIKITATVFSTLTINFMLHIPFYIKALKEI